MFAGCKADRGCTILVSGPSEEELKKIKQVLKSMISQLRNLYLEKEYFKTLGIDPTSIKDHRLKREYLRLLSVAGESLPSRGSNENMRLSPEEEEEQTATPAQKLLGSVTTNSESERQRALGEAGFL